MRIALSRIYFDDRPVPLLDDEARPSLARVVQAGGLSPSDVDVLVLTSAKDATGQPLRPGEVIDRTAEPAKPIYLRSVPRPTPAATLPGTDAVIAQLGDDPDGQQPLHRDRASPGAGMDGDAR